MITLQIAPSAISGGNSAKVEKVVMMEAIPPNRGLGDAGSGYPSRVVCTSGPKA